MILAASSPTFKTLLGRNKHPHPLIYMRGVKSDDLLAIVDFLYRGEANVFQKNLDSFLAFAEELQLKDLMGKMDVKVQDFEDKPLPQTVLPTISSATHTKTILETSYFKEQFQIIPKNLSGDFDNLDEKVNSMMERSSKKFADGRIIYLCKKCGKEGMKSNMKDHIEANHLEGIVIPCNFCEKTFRSRNSLRTHKMRLHQD